MSIVASGTVAADALIMPEHITTAAVKIALSFDKMDVRFIRCSFLCYCVLYLLKINKAKNIESAVVTASIDAVG